jgi:hypothetical protein
MAMAAFYFPQHRIEKGSSKFGGDVSPHPVLT